MFPGNMMLKKKASSSHLATVFSREDPPLSPVIPTEGMDSPLSTEKMLNQEMSSSGNN
jgi:hypothetical protein